MTEGTCKKEVTGMEVITKDRVRRSEKAQADRVQRYHYMLWNMRRRKKHDGRKRIH